MKQCVLKAPAKLNLHLQVGGRCSDGFHEIKSLFIMVDLYDEISTRSLKTGNNCRITGSFNCDVENNLIYKAWDGFCQKAGRRFGVEFIVEKKIPSFAGLGGGSSDAAAALKSMNMLFNVFSEVELAVIAAQTGSDVPFFLSFPAALIGGRGEQIKRLNNARELYFVLINPGVDISTADAYGWIDSCGYRDTVFLSDELISGVYNGSLSGYRMFINDFADVLEARFDIFSAMIDELYKSGAVYSNVTGSGSAVFGMFESLKEAETAENKLKNRYKFVQRIKSLDRIPYAILK